jgi:hypothetical protein
VAGGVPDFGAVVRMIIVTVPIGEAERKNSVGGKLLMDRHLRTPLTLTYKNS